MLVLVVMLIRLLVDEMSALAWETKSWSEPTLVLPVSQIIRWRVAFDEVVESNKIKAIYRRVHFFFFPSTSPPSQVLFQLNFN